MTGLIVILCLILLTVSIVQIARINELAKKIKGEEETRRISANWTGWGFLVFGAAFLIFCVASALYYKDSMLGYGPLVPASEHGAEIRTIFNITLFFTGIVFILTHIALFWFAYKYREQPGRKALFLSHDNKLEIWWTAIPALVMTLLVIGGLDAWNRIMGDIDPKNDKFIEIEATGYQFAWAFRYPGPDNKLGARDFRKITATNLLGMDFRDVKTFDDMIPEAEIVLPVDSLVRVRITSRDVLHNLYIPHHTVKMDAVPGMPTYFIFRPTLTTADYRQLLKESPEYQQPFDPKEPNGPKRWEKFDFEIACAELCGKGHYSMRRVLKIVSADEYKQWLATQKSFYLSNVRNKEEDPNKGKLLPIEISQRAAEISMDVEKALSDTTGKAKTLTLKNVFYETGAATLTADSRYELDNLVAIMNKYPNMRVEISGHTDNVGDPAMNLSLSQSRAAEVVKYLQSKAVDGRRLRAIGFGETKPLGENETEEGRAANRRTEFRIL